MRKIVGAAVTLLAVMSVQTAGAEPRVRFRPPPARTDERAPVAVQPPRAQAKPTGSGAFDNQLRKFSDPLGANGR